MEEQSVELLEIYTKNLDSGETVTVLGKINIYFFQYKKDESEKKTYEKRIKFLKNALDSL